MQDIIAPPGWRDLKSRPGSVTPELGENSDMSPEETDAVDSGEVQTPQGTEGGSVTSVPAEQAIADEFGGEAPAVQDGGAVEADLDRDAGTATIGELGDTALDTLIGEDADEDITDTPTPETAITDKEMAFDMASAELPRREDIKTAEEAGKLTPELKETLEWLASEAAEKAMNNYIDGKSQMTEAEQAILEQTHAYKILRMQGESVESYSEKDFKYFTHNPEEKVKRAVLAEELLASVVELQVDVIMSDESLTAKEKLAKIDAVKSTHDVAQSDLSRASSFNYPERPEDLAGWGSSTRSDEAVPRLWGRVVSSLVVGHGVATAQMIQEIASQEGVEFGEVFEKVAPLVGKALEGTQWQESSNDFIERLGYIWSSVNKRYSKLD